MANKLASLNRLFPNRLAVHLALTVGASGLIYGLVFTVRFPLTRLYATIPPVDYAKLTRHSGGDLVAYVAGIIILFWLYLGAIQRTAPANNPERADSGQPPPTVGGRFLLLSSLTLAAVSLLSYPLTAIDLFIYAIRTRGWALHGLNPLSTAPEQLPAADPWLGLAAEWIDAASPYGPAWEWLSLAAFQLSGGGFLSQLLTLKVVAALAYLGCVWLVYQSLQVIRPEWAIAGTIAFAWNPLVLLESVQNGHNDIIMAFFLMGAVWVVSLLHHPPTGHQPLGRSGSLLLPLTSCLLLALSILVKFITVLVAPFLLLALVAFQPGWGRRLILGALFGLCLAGLVVISMLPFWPGWEDWAVTTAGSQAGRSLLALLVLGLKDRVGLSLAFDLSRTLILGVFGLIYLYFFWQTAITLRRAPKNILPRALASSLFVLFWYVLLAAPVFHAWYLLWFLPLAPLLLPNRTPLRATITFSITALLSIPYFETIRVWQPALLQNQFIGHLIGLPLLVGPPILALLWPISSIDNSEV